MAAGLVDTNVVVDLLRGYEPAERWLVSIGQLGVTRGVYFEIIEGVENKVQLQAALNLLDRFETIEYTLTDMMWATDRLSEHWLSHKIDGYDCLIAAPSHRLQLPLYTRNLKHFAPLLGKLAQEPYT
ncbi:MAG: hypothetical protein CL610_00465 [Anaerolineaceae bacterium]|nr:hypothetical protein [Anaerolineaceae bacterium]